jgi:hypothetical protein
MKKQVLALLCILLLFIPSAHAAIGANAVWEIRATTGSDTNSGGFVAGSTGTDYSQQASPQYSLTGLTTAAASATIATTSASADMVGNIINITGGTLFLTGWYQIVSVVVGTSITVDRAATSGIGAAGTANIGGALKTINKALSVAITSNIVFAKAEATYTTAAGITWSPGNVTPSASTPYTRLVGYTSTRGDGGRATLQGSATGVLIFINNNGISLENIVLDSNSQATSGGIYNPGNPYLRVQNCLVKNWTSYGIYITGGSAMFIANEITGGAGVGLSINAGGSLARYNFIHDNVAIGINSTGNNIIDRNIISNNSGSTSDGISLVTSQDNYITNNTIYKSGRHGIFNSGIYENQNYQNNILSSNGGYGIKGGSIAGLPAAYSRDGNAYYNNTSGTRNNMDDTTVNPQNGVGAYTNIYDVILTADPFVAKASNDYRLNQNPGGGAACRGSAVPSLYPGLTNPNSQAFSDMGAVQHQDPGFAY